MGGCCLGSWIRYPWIESEQLQKIMLDLLPQNIRGSWQEIKHRPEFNSVYGNLPLGDAYCWLNCQVFDASQIPVYSYDKFVFSFHTEFLEYQMLYDFFAAHMDKSFLLITDWIHHEPLFPTNVNTVTWITLHVQAENIIKSHGFCKGKKPTKRLSSLAYRHEFHKAAITSYLLSHTLDSDRVLSWWDIRNKHPYYLEDNYFIHPEISKYILDPSFQTREPIKFDVFDNSPMANTQWRHPAYLDCVLNLSNESVFNTMSAMGRLPGPYITDKTWKVLLSGTGLLPVGQAGTLDHLQSLGLVFDYQIDMSFDSLIQDTERILGIYRTIDVILERSIDHLYKNIKASSEHNINQIVTKKFHQECQDHNDKQRCQIDQWIKN